MEFIFTQHARPNLPGPAFLDLLTRFPNQPLAVLPSGHNQGFSVLARKPLITLIAPDEHSPLQIHTDPDFPRDLLCRDACRAAGDILEQWENVLRNARLNFP